MLLHIQIRDFAIIDAVELELASGLTVLTGETGAGKSILVDALLLAAGGRAGAEVVRHGAERAEVSATFTVANNAAALRVARRAVDRARRRMRAAASRRRRRPLAGYVNGQAMPVQALRQLGETLVDVHGQMEYQSLMRRAAQRELLDQSGDYRELLDAVAEQHRAWSELREQRDRAAASAQDREARLELLRYHLGELKALDLKASEIEELDCRAAAPVAARPARIRRARDPAAAARSRRHERRARRVARADSRRARCPSSMRGSRRSRKAIDESLIALREGVESAERYEADLEADPQRQEWVEQRLAAIESIARKHRVEPAALGTLQAELATEFQQLDTLEASLEQIEKKLGAAADAISRRVRQAQRRARRGSRQAVAANQRR